MPSNRRNISCQFLELRPLNFLHIFIFVPMNERIAFIGSVALWVVLFMISIVVGKADLMISDYLSIFHSSDEMVSNLILNFRLPKSITAILVGIALPIAGFLMQELFKNPLAEPSVLGVTSMSSLGVGIVVFLFSIIGLTQYLNHPWIIIIASFIGAFAALILILSFAQRIKSSASLIILGFMMSGLTVALISLMQYFAPSEQIKQFLMWGFGTLSGLTWSQILIFAFCVTLGLMLTTKTLKGIVALNFGEKYAQTMGIHLKSLRMTILIASALLTSAATAFTGPIGFIGLVIPHLCRSVLKTSNIFLLLKWIIISGMNTMLFFLILTEIFPFGTLPINIITSLIGAPIVISILLNHKFEIKS